MVAQTPSTVRAAALRSRCLSLAKTSSIGFRSGEYFGRKNSIMSFGCGVLISAVAYDLLEDGYQEGGIWPIIAGAITGSAAYALSDCAVSRQGARSRKRSGDQQVNAGEGGGLAIAVGSLLDGIPGLGLLSGKGISIAMLAAIFLSNFPEGLSRVCT